MVGASTVASPALWGSILSVGLDRPLVGRGLDGILSGLGGLVSVDGQRLHAEWGQAVCKVMWGLNSVKHELSCGVLTSEGYL